MKDILDYTYLCFHQGWIYLSASSVLSSACIAALLVLIFDRLIHSSRTATWIRLKVFWILAAAILIRLCLPVYISRFCWESSVQIQIPVFLPAQEVPNVIGNTLPAVLLSIWAAGFLWLHIQDLRRQKRQKLILYDLKQSSRIYTTGQVLEGLPEKAASIPVYVSDLLDSPFSLYRRQGIYMPAEWWETQECFWILQHEIVHIRQHHLGLKKSIHLLCRLYWWVPFISRFERCMELLLELHTDACVLKNKTGSQKKAYMDALIHLAQKPSSQAVMDSASSFSLDLSCRIHTLIHTVRQQPAARILSGAAALFILFSLSAAIRPSFQFTDVDAAYTLQECAYGLELYEKNGPLYMVYEDGKAAGVGEVYYRVWDSEKGTWITQWFPGMVIQYEQP